MDENKALLQWLVNMAEWGVETYRLERLRYGHHDIRGEKSDGTVIVGLYQDEVDKMERVKALIDSLKFDE